MPLVSVAARGIWKRFLNQLLGQGKPSPWQRPTRTLRPRLELLEDRLAPATLTVNSPLDTAPNQSATQLSLRVAVLLIDDGGNANMALGRSLSTGEQAQIDTTQPFGTSDTIVFDSGLNGDTIPLSLGVLELSSPITINGGNQITVSGSISSAIFSVDFGVQVSMSGLTFTAGNTPDNGGAIFNAGTLTVSNSTFSGNNANGAGGAISDDSTGTLKVTDSIFSANTSDNGGAISVDDPGKATVTDCTFNTNFAANGAGGAGGGAIYDDGEINVSGSTFSMNTANAGSGGAIYGYLDGTVIVAGSTFSANTASSSGAIDFEGTLTLNNSTFTGNTASNNGGAVGGAGTATLTGCSFSANIAANNGGAIDNSESLLLIDSTLSGNTATNEGGGGIFNFGSLTVAGSTISGNTASTYGGGVLNDSFATISNSTVVGNQSGQGGGIDNANTLTVLDSTITGNTAVTTGGGSGSGGGIYDNGTTTTTISNSIVAGNLAQATGGGGDIATTGINGNNDLIGDGTQTGFINGQDGNQIGTTANPLNPLLGPLASNGGPTPTMGLLPGSPAINTGGPTNQLAAFLGTTDSTISVVFAAANSNPDDDFVIQIDNEQILVNVDTSLPDTLDIDMRGYNDTNVVSHNSGENVFHAFDQIGTPRVVNGLTDIGAVELTLKPIVVTTQPTPNPVAAGTTFGFVAQAETSSGILDPSFTGTLTASVLTGNGTLMGNVTAQAAGGVATFSGLMLDQAGSYSLVITGLGLAGDTGTFTVAPAAATQLVVTTQPPGVVTTDAGFGLAVAAEDGNGNVNPNYSGTITVTLSAGAGNLTGTATEPVVDGIATFSGLAIDTAGAGDTLQATSSTGLTPATTGPFLVTDDRLVVSAAAPPPASVVSNAPFGFTVQVEDGTANVDQSYNGNITVALSPSSIFLGGNVTMPAQNGVAAFSGLFVLPAGSYPLTVTGDDLAALPLPTPLTVIAAPATQLVVTTQPPTNLGINAHFNFAVSAEDDNNNVDTNYNGGNVVVSLVGPGNLGGTLSAPVIQGVATFTGLTIDQPGSGDYLSISSGTLPDTQTDAFNVTAATQLSIFLEGEANPGVPFTVEIDALDANGQLDPDYNGPVSVSLSTNPTNATLTGNDNLQLVDGSASASLTISNAGNGYVLQASAPGLTSATTIPPFSVTAPLPASQLSGFLEGNAFTNTIFSIQIETDDADFNPASAYSGNVTLTLLNAGSVVFGGTLTQPASGGFASFDDLTISRPGNYTIQATSGTLTPTTIPVTVFNDQLIVPQPPNVIAGAPFGFTVQAQDGNGNVDSSFNGLVTASLQTFGPTGNETTVTKTAQASAGMATFSGFTLTQVDQNYNIELTAPGTAPGNTSVNVTAAPATKLVVTEQPPALRTVGFAFDVTVLAEDPFGNEDMNYNGNGALSIAANPGGGVLGGMVNAPFSFGEADFLGLTISNIGMGYTLKAASGSFATTTSAINVTALGVATQLQVTTQPPDTVTAGVPFGLAVAAEDDFGTVDPGYSGSVTLTLDGLGLFTTAGFQGPGTEPVINGVATFSSLSITAEDADDIFSATSADLAGTTSQNFTVNGAPAVKLVVGAPSIANGDDVLTGALFQLNVFADDQFGNPDPNYNGSAAIALDANPTNTSLLGPQTVSFSGGEGFISGLAIDLPGSGYTLQATGGGLIPGVSPAFNVTNDQLVVTTEPPQTVAAGSSFGFTVSAEDGSGVVDTSFNGSVTVALLDNSTEAGLLGGAVTVQAQNGVATFSGLTLTKVPQFIFDQLSAHASGVGSTDPDALGVEVTVPAAGPATHLALLEQPSGSVQAGANFDFDVAAEDANGIVNTLASGNVTIALSANPSIGTLGGTLTEALIDGEAEFAPTLSGVGTGYAITATSSGLSPVTSALIAVTPAPGTQLVALTSPQTISTDVPSDPITLQIEDAEGNIVPAGAGGLTFILSSTSAGGTFLDAKGNLLANSTLAVPAGATTFSFEYSDSNPGTPTITIAALGFTSATQQEDVTDAPGFANASSTTFIVLKSGVNGSGNPFTFQTGGDPAAALTATGVPAWATFTDNGNGTATLSGTPPAVVTGSYTFDVSAANGVLPNAVQVFTLNVIDPPTFTSSPANQTLLVGTPITAIVVPTSNPLPTKTVLTISPTLPAGLTFTDNGKGTATIAGTPKAGSALQVYTITANNNGNSTASVRFTLTVNAVPVVTTQPKAQSVTLGNVATFTAAATGFPAPTVQWKMKSVGGSFQAIQGATLPTYSFPTTLADIGNQYEAVFTGFNNLTATTAAVGLTILTIAPKITTQPTNQTVAVGNQATFNAAASGDPAPSVQWQEKVNGVFSNIMGAISPIYSFMAPGVSGASQFQAVFTNAAGHVTTSVVTLTVDVPPSVTTQPPQTSMFTAGQPASVSAAATMGTPAPTVQWQISINGGPFTNIPKATSPTYSFTPTGAMDGAALQAVFTNPVGQAISTADLLTVQFAPTIITQPTPQAVTLGSQVTFSAVAAGDPVPTVQWQEKRVGGTFALIPLATSPTYTFTPQQSDIGAQFRAVFTGLNNLTATTNAVGFSVDVAPSITTPPPQFSTFIAGQPASVSVVPGGTPTPTVQWQISTDGVDFTNIPKATSPTYKFTPTAAMDGAELQAVLTNPFGQQTTSTDTLTILSPPAISIQPTPQTVTFVPLGGATVTFTAAATGDPAPSVQWQSAPKAGGKFSNIMGATSPSYTFAPTAADNGEQFQAIFTNMIGMATNKVTTKAAGLTVNVAPAMPTIVTNPLGGTVAVGAMVSVTATASGTPTPTVKWQVSTDGGVSFHDIVPADTTNILKFKATASLNGDEARAVFTNAAGQLITPPVTLTVTQPLAFTSAGSATFIVGQKGKFTVTVQGLPVPSIGLAVTSPSLPAGLTLTDNGNGTATIRGTPQAGTGGTHAITLSISNGGAPVTQTFTLTIDQPPIFTSPDSTTFTAGELNSLVFNSSSTSGFPAATTFTEIGTLPAGITFVKGMGTGVLQGTPKAGAARMAPYTFIIEASDGLFPPLFEVFQLTIMS